MTANLNLTAELLESHASDLERTAAELRLQAAELRTTKPVEPLPTLLSIREACRVSGLSEWAVRKLLAEGKLGEVQVGDRRFVQTVTLHHLAGAA